MQRNSTSGGMNPYLAAGAGGVAGYGGAQAENYIRGTRARSNWALGIGVVLTGLGLVSSSDLTAAQNNAQTLQSGLQAMVIDTTNAASVGVSVNALRNFAITQANVSQQIAYGANMFAFNGVPPAATLAGTTLSAALYPAAVQTATATSAISSTALIVMVLAALAVVALVMY